MSRHVDAGGEILEARATVVDGICRYADKEGIDLFVVGGRGLSAVEKKVTGSVLRALVESASCPVLVVR